MTVASYHDLHAPKPRIWGTCAPAFCQKRATLADPMNRNCLPTTVYLEDTDAQGIVYHANYLKYCERARTDMLKANGYSLGEMQRQGILFVVFEMKLRYHQPARLHDELEVRTHAVRSSDYRITFSHEVFRADAAKPIFSAEVKVVTIDAEGELCPLPEDLLVEDMKREAAAKAKASSA